MQLRKGGVQHEFSHGAGSMPVSYSLRRGGSCPVGLSQLPSLGDVTWCAGLCGAVTLYGGSQCQEQEAGPAQTEAIASK